MNEREIFAKALELESEAEREVFLRRACGSDSQMSDRIRELLAGVESLDDFLEESPVAELNLDEYQDEVVNPDSDRLSTLDLMTEGYVPEKRIPENLKTKIGPYKLLHELGHGGMGVVYMAEQTEPVKRRVAVKIIKPGMDTRQVIARFEAERQALALMDHQNIARVLDAGTTPTGQPFFVMELVKGVPITKYCDDNQLSLRERLDLLIPICHAIQHAHQKGIIHRDIKPTNILVSLYDGQPVPKVIDFGVAKATHQKLTDKTMFTEIGQIVGTLEYMSPEQAEVNQLDVDTRTDVYSLGVVLYELLTGTTPFTRQDLRDVGFNEMLRTIRESEPPKPSTRLSQSGDSLASISAVRQIEPARISRFVRGDLDWIVMKALEKDRMRRYESAASLARDIEHFLHYEPVDAGPPSASYRIRKFVRKHRTGVSVALGLALMVLVCTSVCIWQAVVAVEAAGIAREAEAKANRERDRAEESEQLASHERQTALEAQRIATIERDRARKNAEQAYWNLYTARMQQTQSALNNQDIGEARRLLDLYRSPTNEFPDVRGLEWHYLDRASHQELRTLQGHEIRLSCVAFSPDGRLLASAEGGWDNLNQARMIRIWEVGSGNLVRILTGPNANIHDLAFSPDGRFLASVSYGRRSGTGEDRELVENLLQIWATDDFEEVLRIEDNETKFTSLAFSPDGTSLVAASTDAMLRNGHLRKWSVGGWEAIANFELPNAEQAFPTDVAYSPDGLSIAVVGVGLEGIKIFDATTGDIEQHLDISQDPDVKSGEIVVYPARAPYCTTLCFHPDGEKIATNGHAGNTLLIWDLPNKSVQRLRSSISGGAESIRSLTSSHDGQSIVTGGGRIVSVWSWGGAREVRTFMGHTDEVYGVAASNDGLRIASCGFDQSIKIWDMTDPMLVQMQGVAQMVVDACFEAAGQRIALAVSGFGQGVSLWDKTTGKRLNTLRVETECLRISPNGHRLATSNADNDILLWSLATREIEHRLKGHTKTVRNVEFSRDGRLLAAGSGDCNEAGRDYQPGRLSVWSTETLEMVFSTEDYVNQVIGGTRRYSNIAFSRDSRLMAAVTGQPEADQPFVAIRIWNTETWEEIQSIECSASRVRGLAFDVEGQRIATTYWPRDGLRVFDVVSGDESLRVVHPTVSFDSVQFSVDGARVLVGTGNELLVLDSLSGEQICRISDRIGLPFDANDAVGISLSPNHVNLVKLAPLDDEDDIHSEAQRVVSHLVRMPLQREEVVRRIGEMGSISDEVRTRALELAQNVSDEPIAFYLAAWSIVENSNRSRDSYIEANAYANTATRLAPNDAMMLTARGACEYRLGNYEEANQTLELALQFVVEAEDATPILGLLAMTQSQLGNTEIAAGYLSRAEDNADKHNGNWRNVKFVLEEARKLLGD